MNIEQTTVLLTDTSGTRLSGTRLLLARVLWGLCLVLGVGLFVGTLPEYFAYLHVIVSSAVPGGQLTAHDVRVLHALGLSLDFYAWFTIMVNVLLLLVYVLAGIVPFWRASSDRMALLASFTLVLFPI